MLKNGTAFDVDCAKIFVKCYDLDLVDIGLNVFNPFQPEVIDVFSLFTKEFRAILRAGGVKCVKTTVASPNLNEYYSNCTLLVA